MGKVTLILILFIFNIVLGQHHCGTDHYNEKFINDNPIKYDIIEWELQEYLNSGSRNIKDGNVIIPVVFHIVYKNDNKYENIPDSIIHHQLEVLNESFNLQNTDTSILTDTLKKWVGDMGISFELAWKNPIGNITDGITRTSTDVSIFNLDNKIKNNRLGGADPWNTKKYLNIWVCDLYSSLIGYSQFPGGPDSLDGVVLDYAVVGKGDYGWNDEHPDWVGGRVLVHEIGHWLNLYHPWGNEGGCSDDSIPETEPQTGPIYTFFRCPDTIMTQCGPSEDDMYTRAFTKHYMDYSGNDCGVTFTINQVKRGRASLFTYREEMINSYEESSTPETFNKTKIILNHTYDGFYIELPKYEGELKIVIYDILGRILNIETLSGQRFKQVNLNRYSDGVYIVNLINEGRKVYSQKVIKNKNESNIY
tara:strand:+ start:6164 stop:7423 length:1260 start_codon:yes stop_codon:yes gene_type:complete